MQIQKQIEIAAPADLVWSYILNLDAASQYVPFLAKAAPVGTEPPGMGTHALLTFRYAGRELTTDARVTAFEKPKTLAIHTDIGAVGVSVDVVWDLTPTAKGTRVSETVTLGANGLVARMAMQAMIGQVNADAEMEAGLYRLKTAVEKGQRSPHDA